MPSVSEAGEMPPLLPTPAELQKAVFSGEDYDENQEDAH
jgi:hypothetical protein